MKCVNCITEEMEKFTVDSRVDGYMDCGNECPKCGAYYLDMESGKVRTGF